MRRQIGPTLLVTLLLGSVVGFAYFSNNPDSPWLERAESWPAVGPVAAWFRTAYLPPEGPEPSDSKAAGSSASQDSVSLSRSSGRSPGAATAGGPSAAGESRRPSPRSGPSEDELLLAAGMRRAPTTGTATGEVRERSVEDRVPSADRERAMPRRTDPPAPAQRALIAIESWQLFRAELAVRRAADAGSPVRSVLSAMSYLPVLSRRDPWVEVIVDGERGWIDPTQEPPFNRRKSRRGILRHRAEPVQSNDGTVLRAARKLLGVKRETGNLGPYSLYSDVQDEELLGFLDDAASLAGESYFARYGRLPSGNPRRSVLLFAQEATYRQLAEDTSNIPGGGTWQAGHAARGLLGLYSEGRDRQSLASTLVHEIAHLLNDRSLAYSLPIWLEEGIASDLGVIWVEPDPNRPVGNRIEVRGAAARYLSLRELLKDGRGPPLSALLGLDRENFYSSELRRHAYDLSFAFVRYLLDGDESRHADGFREFLAKIAGGLGANLIEQLGVEGNELEAGFYRWLQEEIDRSRADLERRMSAG